MRITVARLDGRPPLVLDDAELIAEAFFRLDPSAARPDGFDALAGRKPLDEIIDPNLAVINGTMRARSPRTAWEDLCKVGYLPWLAALEPSWDLIELADTAWSALSTWRAGGGSNPTRRAQPAALGASRYTVRSVSGSSTLNWLARRYPIKC